MYPVPVVEVVEALGGRVTDLAGLTAAVARGFPR